MILKDNIQYSWKIWWQIKFNHLAVCLSLANLKPAIISTTCVYVWQYRTIPLNLNLLIQFNTLFGGKPPYLINAYLFALQVHYQLHSCTLKSLLKLFSNSDMLKDKRCKIERGIVDALTQAQLPPLGTAMYDGVWEWVYELVTQAEKAELMMGIGGHVSSAADKKSQQEIPAYLSQTATKVPQDTMDTTGPDTGNQGYLMELPSLEVVPDAAPPAPLPLSEQSSMEHQLSRESPQETHPLGERQLSLSKTSSSSGRSSESDSPLTHASVRSQLLHQCLYGLAVCAVRCPTYFKPLYRLSSTLLKLGLSKVATYSVWLKLLMEVNNMLRELQKIAKSIPKLM